MKRGPTLVRANHIRVVAVLVLMALALLVVPGTVPGGTGLGWAWAQEGAPKGAPERTTPEGASGARVPEPPEIEVQAWALSDADSGLSLVEKTPDEPLPVGSVTKIMSALVVLEE